MRVDGSMRTTSVGTAKEDEMTSRICRDLWVGPARLYSALAGAALVVSAASGCSASPSTAAANASSVASPAGPTAGRTPSRLIHGQITAENGETWTVKGNHGITYTVRLTPLTLYGTLFHRETRDQFKPGDNVRIAGSIFGPVIAPATSVRSSKHGAYRHPDLPTPAGQAAAILTTTPG
jgi:hypothetical protein